MKESPENPSAIKWIYINEYGTNENTIRRSLGKYIKLLSENYIIMDNNIEDHQFFVYVLLLTVTNYYQWYKM